MKLKHFVPALVGTIGLMLGAGAAATQADVLVSNGSPSSPFSQNKQNEPALAVDPINPTNLVSGSNDNINMEACNAGDPTTCPFTPGVGVSGVYLSSDSGTSWTQPMYTGLTASGCLGPDACTPTQGLIGTLPWYYENGLSSGGDPALAFGPKPDAHGNFSWDNGSRLYYANLTANLASKRSDFAFKGIEGVGVSRTDNVAAAASGDKTAWKDPVIIPTSSAAVFSDKEQVWADNAASSPHFGNVYVCYGNYLGGPSAGSAAHNEVLARSTDGGDTWSNVTIAKVPGSTSGFFGVLSGATGCTIRTASDGTVYVFWLGWNQQLEQNGIYMATSTNGGATFSAPRRLFEVFHTGVFDPVQGRFEMDGITGARDDLSDAPSIDIANNAPTGGAGATNEIVMSWVDGGDGLNKEHVMFTTSTDGGAHWTTPTQVETTGDRGYYSAVAISPNGQEVYLVYNAFLAPYQTNTNDPRPLVGVFKSAAVASDGTVGSFTELDRSDRLAPAGDARASSANSLRDEFLGDYVYAVATDSYGAAVWNDVRRADDCPAIDAWRMFLEGGTSVPKPAPEQNCPAHFGNQDIFGFTTVAP